MEELFKHRTFVALVGFGLVVANIVAWAEILKGSFLEVTFFDVGQGDAVFIKTPQNYQIVIDGGPDAKILEKLGKALPFWDKTIDLVILTHPDNDHMAGLVNVLERYDVKNILWTGVQKDTQIFGAWERAIEKEREEGANVVIVQVPQRIIASSVLMDILHPSESEDLQAGEINDTSIVSRLVFGEKSFLFSGDISKKIESNLVELGAVIDIDVLQIAHHGSKTSSDETYLAAASPELGIIQVGSANRYGHPHEDVLTRIANLSIPILRTDQNGDIVIRSDGKLLSVSAAHE